MNRKAADRKGSEASDPFAMPKPDKVISAIGLMGLKTIALNLQDANEGSSFQVFFGSARIQPPGLFKILAGEAKETSPPQFRAATP